MWRYQQITDENKRNGSLLYHYEFPGTYSSRKRKGESTAENTVVATSDFKGCLLLLWKDYLAG
jgi:hypothetical protein